VSDGCRDPRTHHHALGAVLPLQVAGELVELGEHAALRIRQEQLDRPQALLEGVPDPVAELLEPLSGGRGDHRGARLLDAEFARVVGIQQIDLVEDQ
jgi:hypothetical protein